MKSSCISSHMKVLVNMIMIAYRFWLLAAAVAAGKHIAGKIMLSPASKHTAYS